MMEVASFLGGLINNEIIRILLGSAILSSVYNHFAEKRKKRVELYSRGIFLISERAELYYRVLRRGCHKGSSNCIDKELIEEFHKNQSQIIEHKALLMVDCGWLGDSYSECFRCFSRNTADKFRQAWRSPLKMEWDEVPEDRRINVEGLLKVYAKDCRRKLNPTTSMLAKLRFYQRRIIKHGHSPYDRSM